MKGYVLCLLMASPLSFTFLLTHALNVVESFYLYFFFKKHSLFLCFPFELVCNPMPAAIPLENKDILYLYW